MDNSGNITLVDLVSDAIVQFDQNGVPQEDRVRFWVQNSIDRHTLERAEERVENRYKALGRTRRSRRSRW